MRIEPSPQRVAEAFAKVSGSAVFDESRALTQAGGQPVEMIRAMAAGDGMLEAFAGMCGVVYPGGTLPRDVQEAVILTASVRNSCQFCHQSHIDIVRAHGIASDPEQWIGDRDAMSPHQRLACRYTEQVMDDANAVDDAIFAAVHKAFGDAGTVELTMLVGYINMLNMFNNALRNQYHGEIES